MFKKSVFAVVLLACVGVQAAELPLNPLVPMPAELNRAEALLREYRTYAGATGKTTNIVADQLAQKNRELGKAIENCNAYPKSYAISQVNCKKVPGLQQDVNTLTKNLADWKTKVAQLEAQKATLGQAEVRIKAYRDYVAAFNAAKSYQTLNTKQLEKQMVYYQNTKIELERQKDARLRQLTLEWERGNQMHGNLHSNSWVTRLNNYEIAKRDTAKNFDMRIALEQAKIDKLKAQIANKDVVKNQLVEKANALGAQFR